MNDRLDIFAVKDSSVAAADWDAMKVPAFTNLPVILTLKYSVLSQGESFQRNNTLNLQNWFYFDWT